jgi:pyruvyl transferase EpsO
MLRRGDRDDDIWVLPPDVSCTTTDWNLPRHRDRIARVLALPDRLGNKLPPFAVTSARLRTATYPRISSICVDEALRTLAKGRVLVTDRMHAAVMGAMLGMPTVALDLAYREAGATRSIGAIHEQKISAAYEVWMGRLPNLVLLRDPADIQQTVADLVRSE